MIDYLQTIAARLPSLGDDRLVTVVETRAGYEAFLSWTYVGGLNVPDGSKLEPIWLVEAWSLWVSTQEDRNRTYLSSHGVELLYHTFNEAMWRRVASAVYWRGLQGQVTVVADRAEFVDQGRGVWSRFTHRPDTGATIQTYRATGAPLT